MNDMGIFFSRKRDRDGVGGYDGGYEIELAKAKMARVKEPPQEAEPEAQLTLDISQTSEDIIVESAIAGVRPEDIDVNVTEDSVSIKGNRSRGAEESRDYLYQECYWGRFARSVILPEAVDPEHADVCFKNGVLTIRLPKANRKKSKKLQVRVD